MGTEEASDNQASQINTTNVLNITLSLDTQQINVVQDLSAKLK